MLNLEKRIQLGVENLLFSGFLHELDLEAFFVSAADNCFTDFIRGLIADLKMADGSVKYLLDWSALIAENNTLQITSV